MWVCRCIRKALQIKVKTIKTSGKLKSPRQMSRFFELCARSHTTWMKQTTGLWTSLSCRKLFVKEAPPALPASCALSTQGIQLDKFSLTTILLISLNLPKKTTCFLWLMRSVFDLLVINYKGSLQQQRCFIVCYFSWSKSWWKQDT